ncbi:MAG TPA: condensation domain-containing protein [Polyangia bacterium]|nr:condensation domain-containing protein [Polyangia bacterium]
MITYPCDYVDKGGLAVTDNARGCSGTPTWQLVVAGALDAAHVRAALADVVARYPPLRCKVQALDGEPLRARRFAYVEDPEFDLDACFRVVDARDEATLAALVHEEQNRPLDLFRDAPLTLTLARTGDDSCRLFFRQHHAIADGRAFIGLLVDFAAFLDAARAGRRPAAEALARIDRKGELEPLRLPPARRFAWRLAGYVNLVRMILAALFRPVVPLLQNRSNDYSGDNGTVHWIIADDVLASWNAARKRLGVSLNSMLTAALFCANQRWHRARGAPLGRTSSTLVMETRPRDGGFVSFANHLATLDVELALGSIDDPAAMARAIQAQVDAQRRTNRPLKRLLAERAIVLGMPLAQLRRIVFESKHPSYNLNFSNLIALDFPTLGGDGGWRVDAVLITTPVTPRTGIALTAIRYNGRLAFNFNYKSSVVTRADTEALCREFQSVVAQLARP